MQQWVACDCTLQGTFWFNENLVLNFNGVVGSREMLCHRFSLASFALSACCLCNFFWLTGYELLVCSKAGHRSTPSPLIRIYGGGKSKMCQSSGGVRDPDRGSAARTEKWGHREGVEFKKNFFFGHRKNLPVKKFFTMCLVGWPQQMAICSLQHEDHPYTWSCGKDH